MSIYCFGAGSSGTKEELHLTMFSNTLLTIAANFSTCIQSFL